MILEFLKETPTKRGNGKFHKIGSEVFLSGEAAIWGNEQIELGNAKRIDIGDYKRKTIHEILNDANKEKIKKAKKLKEDK